MTKKNISILTFSFILVASVLVNEMVLRKSKNSSDQDRDVASFGERFEPSQIKWEHELAQSVANDKQAKTLIGKKPNIQDKVLYEVFEGRYEAILNQGKIQKISLLQNQTPVVLKTEDFLKNYIQEIFKYDHYTVLPSDTVKNSRDQFIQLLNASGNTIGTLQFTHDDQGRVLEIQIK